MIIIFLRLSGSIFVLFCYRFVGVGLSLVFAYRYVGYLAKPGRGFAVAVAVCFGFNLVGSRGDQSRGTVSLSRLSCIIRNMLSWDA